MAEAPARTFDAAIKDSAIDRRPDAGPGRDLTDYLKEAYGIRAAAAAR
jgi:hypothetical protein